MRKFMIKMGIFIIISTYALFDYRMLSFQNNRLLIANWHQVSTWSEVESLVVDANQAEVYPSRAVRRSNSYDQKYVVIYLDNNFYNIKATDLEMARIEKLMAREQIDVVAIEPLDAWFYGLLVVLLIIFPVMRKEESYINKA